MTEIAELTRPIVGIENRTAQEVFGIMVDRISAWNRRALSPSPVVKALERQTDNVAFILNHVALPDHWYDKFKSELEEDRAALTKDTSNDSAPPANGRGE